MGPGRLLTRQPRRSSDRATCSATDPYVGPSAWGKTITQSEYNSYLQVGIDVWLVFERATGAGWEGMPPARPMPRSRCSTRPLSTAVQSIWPVTPSCSDLILTSLWVTSGELRASWLQSARVFTAKALCVRWCIITATRRGAGRARARPSPATPRHLQSRTSSRDLRDQFPGRTPTSSMIEKDRNRNENRR